MQAGFDILDNYCSGKHHHFLACNAQIERTPEQSLSLETPEEKAQMAENREQQVGEA